MPIKYAVGDWTSTNIQYFLCKRDFRKSMYCCRAGSRPSEAPLSQEMKLGGPLQQIFQNINGFKM